MGIKLKVWLLEVAINRKAQIVIEANQDQNPNPEKAMSTLLQKEREWESIISKT